jgi:quercetin dioxygenase-like cupin family protein
MYAVCEEDVPATILSGRSVLQLLTEKSGCKNISMGVSFFAPRAHAPGHIHEQAEEAIYIVAGVGRIYIGDSIESLTPGTAVYIPAGVEHSVENTGPEPIKLVYAFSPPVVPGTYADIISR